MRTFKSLLLAGLMVGIAAPAFAAAPAKGSHHWVAKGKKKKAEDRCDAAGKPCKEGEDCKLENCQHGGAAPGGAPGGEAPGEAPH